ncbi:uncharacterized protein QC763_511365 [Podospora pseudopauciseta]|uniref:Uncharacterized protein n=1 Tax=Podospora pseudopauciseta TaxID=2093780 RepID=A0ABR0HB44_9PEZI|nr:hypothetical protein QC763_511365 [Podospora pseudopauciseta]
MRSTTTTTSISDNWSDIDADSDDSYSMVEAPSDSGFNYGAGTGLAPATTTVPTPTNLPAQGPFSGSHITAGPGTGPDTEEISTVPDAEEADDAQFLSETVTGDTIEASSEAHGEDASASESEEEEEEEARAQLLSYPFHGDKARGISSQLLDCRQAMLQIRDHPAVHSRVHGVILGALNHVLESTCGPGPHLNKFIAGSHDYHAFLVHDTSGYSIEHSPCLHEPIVAACLELRNKLDGPDGPQDIVGAVGSLGDLLMTWTKKLSHVSEAPFRSVYLWATLMDLRPAIYTTAKHLLAIRETINTSLARMEGGAPEICLNGMRNINYFCAFGISSCDRLLGAIARRLMPGKHLWRSGGQSRGLRRSMSEKEAVEFSQNYAGLDITKLAHFRTDIKLLETKLDRSTRYTAAGAEWRDVVCNDQVGEDNWTRPASLWLALLQENTWARQASPWLALSQEREKKAWRSFYLNLAATVNLGELTRAFSAIPGLTSYLEAYRRSV